MRLSDTGRLLAAVAPSGGEFARLPAFAQRRRYEAIAPAWNVGDVALTGSTIAERLAQRGDMSPQGALVDHRIGPGAGD